MPEISKVNLHREKNEKEIIQSYWQSRAKDFAALRLQELHCEKYTQWQKEILAQLPARKGLKILDVGCGAGFFSIILNQNGMEMTGIDITPEMIAEAKLLAKKEKATADFIVMDAEQLNFPDNTFDAVIARNVTWNLPHPEKAYAEWIRVLKPGGILLNSDAEYAKHHHDALPEVNAHSAVTEKQNEHCHKIYHMLEVSLYARPAWDVEVLQALGTQVTVDLNVNARIYPKKDWFYSPAPIFFVKAIKK